jgi:hypothetical protein
VGGVGEGAEDQRHVVVVPGDGMRVPGDGVSVPGAT